MDLVKLAINKPVGVAVGVILVVAFGLIGVTAIPVQLTPTVDRPIITVTTEWPGRSPEEVVDEIVKDQEEELKNVSNLKRMKATATEGEAVIELEFYLGTSIPRVLQEVSDNLRQVPDYPEEVEEPRVEAADGASENAIAWIIVDVDPEHVERYPSFDITSLYDPLDKEVKPFLERVDGVAEVNIFGGREREVRVLIDEIALAQRNLNHLDVIDAIRSQNQTISAGTIAEGKRDYRVRVVGQFERVDELEEVIIAVRDGVETRLRDVATVELGLEKQRGFVRTFGHPSVAMNVIRQSGANVVAVMDDLRGRLEEVRAERLPKFAPEGYPTLGQHLRIRQVYDETTYIDSAMNLVTTNLFIGGALAAVVLMVFLRSFVSTAIIAIAIPISVIGTFLIMLAMGRTLNIISLAGLAFAVGMVVDNAIVVLENIYRRLQNGDPPLRAAYLGGKEVWGAILASTLTTAAVFVPVLTIQEEAGQLFRDIAIAIVAAVLLSLVVSVTVIPTATARFLREKKTHRTALGKMFSTLFGIDAVAGWFVRRAEVIILWLMTSWRGWTLRPALILILTGVSLGGAAMLAPPLDYLPAGNRNLVFGGLNIPPGLSIEEKISIAERIEEVMLPYVEADETNYLAADLAPIPIGFGPPGPDTPSFDPVPVQNFFLGAFGSEMFAGGTSDLEQVVIPVGQLLSNAIGPIPDVFGGASQSSIFGRGPGGGNTVDLEISGERLEAVLAAAGYMFFLAADKEHANFGYGPTGVSPEPGNFNLRQQEWQLRLTDEARELGFDTETVGVAIRGLFDGAFAGDFKLADDTIDIRVLPRDGELELKESLLSVPIATPAGPVVPVDTLVDVIPALAPQDILRIEELPAVILRVKPPQGMTVEEAETKLRAEVVEPARQAGLLDRTMRINLEGTAAKLDEVNAALFGVAPVGEDSGPFAKAAFAITAVLFAAGLVTAVIAAARAAKRKSSLHAYGILGALGLALAIGLPLLILGLQPQLVMARMAWALLVTYLLMAALFDSFVYPFVIMFTVPLAVVGGFAGLAIVHNASLANPTIAPQQLDVLTMLGFVILVGVVVNNAILLVHQSLNFMKGVGESDDDRVDALPPLEAIAASVRTRIRPIFMSVLTSVGGMLPLVLFPGAGSEMYRGLGSVVVGGLLVSTVFTLLLVPLLFSLTLQSMDGLKAVFAKAESQAPRVTPDPAPAPENEKKPALQPA
ncbi:MAG: efflux RND transporter permease subunit [Planctomycetota bacterium]